MTAIEITTNDANSLEYYISIIMLGTLTALLEKCITTGESQQLIFQPSTIFMAKNLKMSPEIIDQLEWGLEIEDVESLNPASLEKAIEKIKKSTALALKKLSKPMLPLNLITVNYNGDNYDIISYLTDDQIKNLHSNN